MEIQAKWRIRSRTLALLPALLLAGCVLSAQTVDQNVIYGMYSGLALLMDVHYPAQPNGYGIIYIPGSGWSAGLAMNADPLKDIADGAANHLAEAGYTVFVIDHRATPRFVYPAPIEDAQRAVRFVRFNAAKFHIDKDRIGAAGGSSGGHLALMLGVLDGKGDPNDLDPINRVSAKVQAVVVRAPPVDLAKLVRSSNVSFDVALFLGAQPPSPGDNSVEARLYAEASPVTHVTAEAAPTLIFNGDADPSVPIEQARIMENALRKVGVPVKVVPVPGGKHGPGFGFPAGDPRAPDIWIEGAKWFDRYLRPRN